MMTLRAFPRNSCLLEFAKMMTNVGHSSFEKGPFKLDGVAEIFSPFKKIGASFGGLFQPFRIKNS